MTTLSIPKVDSESPSLRDAKTHTREARATRSFLPRFIRESPLDATKRQLARLRDASDARLREHADALRAQPSPPHAIALIAEAVRRTRGLVPYDVQLHAGLVLAEGRIAEMATGEGKTLVTLLPACCFALEGRGAHVATVNSYLSERDCEFARPAFERLGMTVGFLIERDSKAGKSRDDWDSRNWATANSTAHTSTIDNLTSTSAP